MLTSTYSITDVVGNRVYHAAYIRYRVKGDVVENEIEIPAAGNFELIISGEEKGLIRNFDVFLDNSPVKERIQAIFEKEKA